MLMESANPADGAPSSDDVPAFRRRARNAKPAAEVAADAAPAGEAEDQAADALPDPEPQDDEAGQAGDTFEEDEVPPYAAARPDAEATREAERELEREASGFTAEETLGSNGKPLVVGDPAIVEFGTGKAASEKSGTLLAIEGTNARVRLKGNKDPLGELFPHKRVHTEPVNNGKPLTSKAAQRVAGAHAQAMVEFREAGKARPSEGFAHAQAAADEEVAPLPKRALRGDNKRLSDATIHRYVGAIRAQAQRVASENGKLRELKKKAKDDGVDTKVLNQILGELKLSPEELIDQINLENHYRSAVHLPHAEFLHTFGEEDRDTAEKRIAHATEEGARAGYRGADMSSNPWPSEQDPCHAAWNEAWRKAQSTMLGKGLKEKVD
jgi:hypothetical protein